MRKAVRVAAGASRFLASAGRCFQSRSDPGDQPATPWRDAPVPADVVL